MYPKVFLSHYSGDKPAVESLAFSLLEISRASADANPGNAFLRRTELIQRLQRVGLAAALGDAQAIRLHLEAAEQILAFFDREGLFTGDAQIQAVREMVTGLRSAMDAVD